MGERGADPPAATQDSGSVWNAHAVCVRSRPPLPCNRHLTILAALGRVGAGLALDLREVHICVPLRVILAME